MDAFITEYIEDMKRKQEIVSKEDYIRKIISIIDKYAVNSIDDDPDGSYKYSEKDYEFINLLSNFFSFIENLGGIVVEIKNAFYESYITFEYDNVNYRLNTISGQGSITTLSRNVDSSLYEPSILLSYEGNNILDNEANFMERMEENIKFSLKFPYHINHNKLLGNIYHNPKYPNSYHKHSFKEVIKVAYMEPKAFYLTEEDEEFYSKQEYDFINKVIAEEISKLDKGMEFIKLELTDETIKLLEIYKKENGLTFEEAINKLLKEGIEKIKSGEWKFNGKI